MLKTIKCPYCKNVFFAAETKKCPFCHYDLHAEFGLLGAIFDDVEPYGEDE